MCGITGTYAPKSFVNAPDFYKAHKLLRHRGPDDEGFVSLSGSTLQSSRGDDTIAHFRHLPMIGTMQDCQLILGHHRLSIIDLSYHGHQPFAYRELTVAYNGEIYNYIELRDELVKQGYTFQTQTDTEVFLKAYDCWGQEAFQKFIGMWAAAIYDHRQKSLLLTRDSFGIKPLYYALRQDSLSFASEIKFLTALHPELKQPDKAAIYDFIIYGQKDFSRSTLYQSIQQLEPGALLTFDGSRLRHIPQNHSNGIMSGYQSVEEVKRDVLDSINLHLRADVPVGVSLSGGVDSSVIAGALASNGREIHTYSAVFPEYPEVDESGYIQSTLDKYSGKIHESWIKPTGQDVYDSIETILWHMDEPYRAIGMILPFDIYKQARLDGVKVMLGGQGGDELFVGYRMQMVAYAVELFKRFKWSRLIRESWQGGIIDRYFLKALLLSFTELNSRWRRLLRPKSHLFNLNEPTPFESSKTHSDPTERKYYFNFGLRDYLNNEDRMSMAHSVEARVPLLSRTLYKKAIVMRFEELVHANTSKYWLRTAFKSELSPDVYSRQDKMGYLSPQHIWLEQFKDAFSAEIERCELWNDDRAEINRIAAQNDDKCWRVYITSRWYNSLCQ